MDDAGASRIAKTAIIVSPEASHAESVIPHAAASEATEEPQPPTKVRTSVLCCKRCRAPLFRKSIAIDGIGAMRSTPSTTDQSSASALGPTSADTNSYFLKEALRWMEDTSKDVEGKLYCPSDRCTARVGSLNWVGV